MPNTAHPLRPTWLAALALSALLAGSPAAWAACPRVCLSPLSIKNAAGVDPTLFARIEFSAGQAGLASPPEVIDKIAAAWKASPRRAVLRISTLADDGLRGTPARKLAAARAAALAKALTDAGVPAAKVRVAGR